MKAHIGLIPLGPVPEDVKAEIHALDRVCFPDDEPITDWRRTRWWTVRTRDGTLVGYASLTVRPHRVGYLSRVGVRPAHRKHGVWTALLAAQVAWARGEGYRSLVSDTVLTNTAPQRGLIAAGFVPFRPHRKWGLKTSLYWRLDL